MKNSTSFVASRRFVRTLLLILVGCVASGALAGANQETIDEGKAIRHRIETLHDAWSPQSVEGPLDEKARAHGARTLEVLANAIERLPRAERPPLILALRQVRNRFLARLHGDPPPRAEALPVPTKGAPIPAGAADLCANAPVIGPGSYVGFTLDASNDGSATCGGSFASADVWLRYRASSSGTVYFDLQGSNYDAVLSVHDACPGTYASELACLGDAYEDGTLIEMPGIQAGDELLLRISGRPTGVERGRFVLHAGPGGGIVGRVTDRATGAPITGIQVRIYDAEGDSVGSDETDATGHYAVGGLPTGTYHAVIEPTSIYRAEAWPDLPCPLGVRYGCQASDGQRIAVTSDALTEGIDFRLAVGGRIEGTVREIQSDALLGSVWVRLVDGGGRQVDSRFTGTDGRYAFVGLDGTYFVYTDTSRPFDVLYGGSLCPADCDPLAGTPIEVGPGSTFVADLTLPAIGSIGGVVRDAATGAVVPFAELSLRGGGLDFETADVEGRYRFEATTSGEHLVVVRESEAYLAQYYLDVPCSAWSCDVQAATPVVVGPAASRDDIDFALRPGARLRGRVTDAVTGLPLADRTVTVFRDDGFSACPRRTDADGRWVSCALTPGTYYAADAGREDDTFVGQAYPGVSCMRDLQSGRTCDVTVGTPITLAEDEVLDGIDFALTRWGAIEGRVTDGVTGAPLAGIVIWLEDEDGHPFSVPLGGSFFDDVETDADGRYRVDLPPGTYFVRARTETHLDQVFAGIDCQFSDCWSIVGTPVIVAADEVASGIDLALDPGSYLSGRVTEAVTGEPLRLRVNVMRPDGSTTGIVSAASDGTWRKGPLLPGSYFVAHEAGSRHLAGLFDGVGCGLSCGAEDFAAATAVELASQEEQGAIDFVAHRRPAIGGRLIDADTGEGLRGSITFYDTDGRAVRNFDTESDGSYRVDDLLPGRYFASARRDGYLGVLLGGTPCSGCDVTQGTPIDLAANDTRTDVDFVISLGGRISGQVREVEGAPIANATIQVWDTDGNPVASARTEASGRYEVTGLVTGSYHVGTTSAGHHETIVLPDIPCTLSCAPTDGTRFAVQTDQTTAGVDFTLRRLGMLSGQATNRATGEPIPGIEVSVYDHRGHLDARPVTDEQGRYTVRVIGEVFLVARSMFYNDQRYEGVPCPADDCDPLAGTPVVIAQDQAATEIDFTLDRARCQPTDQTLCLRDRRFAVDAFWREANGSSETAGTVPLTDDAGYFFFANDQNVEIVVKVLDACGTSFDSFWVFAAGLTNLGVHLRVVDTWTGALVDYGNPQTVPFAPIQDTRAFATCDAVPPVDALATPTPPVEVIEAESKVTEGTCMDAPDTLCLGGRFAVRSRWRTNDDEGVGTAVRLTEDTGYFWFFDPDNIESIVKVLDACGSSFDSFWVFAGGLTNVEVELEVTDTATGEVKTYVNPQGTPFQPIQDTQAFFTCP